jgi:hypothetical protein
VNVRRSKEKQDELVRRKNQETLERLTLGRAGSEGGAGGAAAGRKVRAGMGPHMDG